jgi:hypothetical protein
MHNMVLPEGYGYKRKYIYINNYKCMHTYLNIIYGIMYREKEKHWPYWANMNEESVGSSMPR